MDINIAATTGADLNHLVRNILKTDFIIYYATTYELTWNAPANKSKAGRFQRTKTFNAVDLYLAEDIFLTRF